MHYSAKRGLAITCRLSVRPSVRLSVTLVDHHDHIGCKSWKLIARTISSTVSLFAAERSSTYSQGNMEKFWGDWRWGGKKWHAGAQKRQYLQNALRLLWRAYRKSPTLFRFFRSPPYFYFRFRLYGHWDGRFCLIFARTAQQSAGLTWIWNFPSISISISISIDACPV